MPVATLGEKILALPGNVRGALWVLAAALLFSVMGTVVKLLADDFDSFQIAFFRAVFGLLAITPFVFKMGLGKLKTRRLPLHLARSVLGTMGMLCGFYALTHLSYADAVALSYARGLFLIPLAVIFLHEVVRRRRWTATLLGFLGVVIMLRPGVDLGSDMELATLVALVGALIVALVTIIIKKLVTTERPETLIFYFGVVSSLAALIPALYVWRAPSLGQTALLMLVGCVGAAGQYCVVRGYRVGEATALIPFDYARLLFAALIGIILFAEIPDIWTLSGAAVIVASTLYIALREVTVGKAAAGEKSDP